MRNNLKIILAISIIVPILIIAGVFFLIEQYNRDLQNCKNAIISGNIKRGLSFYLSEEYEKQQRCIEFVNSSPIAKLLKSLGLSGLLMK